NLSSDATAPGTSGLINQTAADVFVNVASDLHLKAGSPAIGAGNKVLDFDALGNPRGTPDDMGALTTYVEPTGGGIDRSVFRGSGRGLMRGAA
ncbi:MAG: choice-of-anchor Q domain-containing protein, partial [Planctomycetaceae bacterium]